jgi:hypothetical protein
MIFLSYSRENAQEALRLESEIKKEGYQIIKDPPLVEGNPFWRAKIKEIFHNCKVMIVLGLMTQQNLHG